MSFMTHYEYKVLGVYGLLVLYVVWISQYVTCLKAGEHPVFLPYTKVCRDDKLKAGEYVVYGILCYFNVNIAAVHCQYGRCVLYTASMQSVYISAETQLVTKLVSSIISGVSQNIGQLTSAAWFTLYRS